MNYDIIITDTVKLENVIGVIGDWHENKLRRNSGRNNR